MHILSTSLNKIFKTECYCQLHTFFLRTLLQSEDFYKVYLSRNSYPLIGRPGHQRVAATHHPLLPLLPVSPSHQSLWRLGISVTPGNNGQSHGITRCFQAETCSLEVSPPICKLTVNSVQYTVFIFNKRYFFFQTEILKSDNFCNLFKENLNKKFKNMLQDILWTYTELIVLMNKA